MLIQPQIQRSRLLTRLFEKKKNYELPCAFNCAILGQSMLSTINLKVKNLPNFVKPSKELDRKYT